MCSRVPLAVPLLMRGSWSCSCRGPAGSGGGRIGNRPGFLRGSPFQASPRCAVQPDADLGQLLLRNVRHDADKLWATLNKVKHETRGTAKRRSYARWRGGGGPEEGRSDRGAGLTQSQEFCGPGGRQRPPDTVAMGSVADRGTAQVRPGGRRNGTRRAKERLLGLFHQLDREDPVLMDAILSIVGHADTTEAKRRTIEAFAHLLDEVDGTRGLHDLLEQRNGPAGEAGDACHVVRGSRPLGYCV